MDDQTQNEELPFFNNWPSLYGAKEDLEEESLHDWWTKQFLIMFAGILCGFVANSFLRRGGTHKETSSGFMRALFSKETKMVFLVRSDVPMGKGKMASQVAHAAVMCYREAMKKRCQHLSTWESTGQMKVVLKVPSEEEMITLVGEASKIGLSTSLVRDAGRTQIMSGTRTVAGIGPGPLEVIDNITGHLKLY